MGKDDSQTVNGRKKSFGVVAQNNSFGVKAHTSMCGELIKILDRINHILPAIESARPGCRNGIQELCSLNNTIEKAKLLLQHCAESSKLYLAITGEATLLRCERIRTTLIQSLIQIQNMVPELLAAQISEIVDYLSDAKFSIDSSEEDAGKVMLQLLHQIDATAEAELEAFQVSALKFGISSPRAILLERRSIKKLLHKLQGTDPKKEGILKFFLYLLKKYSNQISPDIGEQKENGIAQDEVLTLEKESKCDTSDFECEIEVPDNAEAQSNPFCINAPPEQFLCPISLKVMFDPVVISSGQTYERMWIEKWFHEGNDTCPKTQKKLSSLSMVPNSSLKDLISKWCIKHGMVLEELGCHVSCTGSTSSTPAYSDSICSLQNVPTVLLDEKRGNYILQSDQRSVSLISSDTSPAVLSHVKGIESSSNNHSCKSEDEENCQIFLNFSQDKFLQFFNNLSELPPESQSKAVEHVKILLDVDVATWHAMLSNGFAGALVSFLKNAFDLSNVQAQRTGAQILLTVLGKWRVEAPSLVEDALQMLLMFLDSNIIKETLMIIKILLCIPKYLTSIVAYSILPSIIEALNCEETEIQELAVNIIFDLSAQREAKSHIITSHCLSKLVPLMSDSILAKSCIKIMLNLCDTVECALLIAETNGCIPSIVELLDNGGLEEQEHAVVVLHSLCLHSLDSRLLVTNEGVIPALCSISLNGTSKAKEFAMKLLIVLREHRDSDCFDSPDSQPDPGSKPGEIKVDHSTSRPPTSKASPGFFGKKFRFLYKPWSLAIF